MTAIVAGLGITNSRSTLAQTRQNLESSILGLIDLVELINSSQVTRSTMFLHTFTSDEATMKRMEEQVIRGDERVSKALAAIRGALRATPEEQALAIQIAENVRGVKDVNSGGLSHAN